MWDAAVYARYGDERARPFDDLLARVRAQAPTYVVDLGCGPGDRTATLLERWQGATVLGVDSSAELLAAARPREVPGRLAFVQGDLRDWRPDRPVDVLVSNARRCSGSPVISSCCPGWSMRSRRAGSWPSRSRATSPRPATSCSPS